MRDDRIMRLLIVDSGPWFNWGVPGLSGVSRLPVRWLIHRIPRHPEQGKEN